MQFLSIWAAFSGLLFSVSLASETKGSQLDDRELNSIVNSVVDEMSKAQTKLAKTGMAEFIVEGLDRQRSVRCQLVDPVQPDQAICHFISSQTQLKVPETGELFPVKVSFDLKASLDHDHQLQQLNKIKNLTVEGMNIKLVHNQKLARSGLFGLFGFLRFIQPIATKLALTKSADGLSDVAKYALKRTAKFAVKKTIKEKLKEKVKDKLKDKLNDIGTFAIA